MNTATHTLCDKYAYYPEMGIHIKLNPKMGILGILVRTPAPQRGI